MFDAGIGWHSGHLLRRRGQQRIHCVLRRERRLWDDRLPGFDHAQHRQPSPRRRRANLHYEHPGLHHQHVGIRYYRALPDDLPHYRYAHGRTEWELSRHLYRQPRYRWWDGDQLGDPNGHGRRDDADLYRPGLRWDVHHLLHGEPRQLHRRVRDRVPRLRTVAVPEFNCHHLRSSARRRQSGLRHLDRQQPSVHDRHLRIGSH